MSEVRPDVQDAASQDPVLPCEHSERRRVALSPRHEWCSYCGALRTRTTAEGNWAWRPTTLAVDLWVVAQAMARHPERATLAEVLRRPPRATP